MKVEVLHYRDPDSSCDITVWIDGKLVDCTVEDIDPGRGYMMSDWEERIRDNRENTTYSEPFRQAVDEALEAASGSKYIEDDSEYIED